MHHQKEDVNATHIPRKEGKRTMINRDMSFKSTSVGLNTYLLPSDDRMLKLVLQDEKKNKIHLVTKKSKVQVLIKNWHRKKMNK